MAVNQNFKESTVSTSNHTQNYDLPLWTEGDKTSWLTQVNDAMNKIDSGMVDAKSKALEVVGIAADAKKLAEETSAESKESAKIVAGYNDRLTAVEATSVEHTNDITALNTRCDQMDVEIHSVKETQKKTTEDLGTLADQVKHNKEDADATKQSVSVLNGNVVELTGRVTTCEDDIEALKVTTAANTKNIAQAEENVATVTGKVTALETEVGEVSAATQSNTTAISAINASIESIKSKDTAQDEKIATNTTEISSLDGRVTALEDGGGSSIKDYQSVKRKSLRIPITADDVLNITSAGPGTAHPTSLTNGNITLKLFGDGSFYIEIGDNALETVITMGGSYGLKISKTDIDGLTKKWISDVIGTTIDVWGKSAVLTNGNSLIGHMGNNTYRGMERLADFQLSEKTLIIDIRFREQVNSFNISTEGIRLYGHLETVGEVN